MAATHRPFRERDELDNIGRHIAVMSRHEGTFSYASQFLGTCE